VDFWRPKVLFRPKALRRPKRGERAVKFIEAPRSDIQIKAHPGRTPYILIGGTEEIIASVVRNYKGIPNLYVFNMGHMSLSQ
jgi:hypothetical protein